MISVPLNLGAFPLETKPRCSCVEKYGVGPVEIAPALQDVHIHIKPLPGGVVAVVAVVAKDLYLLRPNQS